MDKTQQTRNGSNSWTLKTPIVALVIGEGGSGGALAIGVADRVLMLQYAIYSVISPEGCASILWRSPDKAEVAAEAMGITADRLIGLDLVHEVIQEPLGGAHRDPDATAEAVKNALLENLRHLKSLTTDQLLKQRYNRLRSFGSYDSR